MSALFVLISRCWATWRDLVASEESAFLVLNCAKHPVLIQATSEWGFFWYHALASSVWGELRHENRSIFEEPKRCSAACWKNLLKERVLNILLYLNFGLLYSKRKWSLGSILFTLSIFMCNIQQDLLSAEGQKYPISKILTSSSLLYCIYTAWDCSSHGWLYFREHQLLPCAFQASSTFLSFTGDKPWFLSKQRSAATSISVYGPTVIKSVATLLLKKLTTHC